MATGDRHPLASMIAMVDVGDEFPSFVLQDQDGSQVSSADLLGSWYLLYWYPKADTPGCVAQAQSLRHQIEAFDELGCRILGASFDEPSENVEFRAKYQLPFSLLSDRDHELAVKVGAADSPQAGYAQRVAHLVSPDGFVKRFYVVEDPEYFAERVLDDLEAAST